MRVGRAEVSARRQGGAALPWRHAALEAAKAVAVTRVLFLVVGYASAWLLSSTRGALDQGFFDIWVHWDARHFLEVAAFGYTDPATDPNAPAFFPLYPLTVGALDGLGLPPVPAAMIVSTAATWVACIFLYLLAEEDEGEGAGRAAVLYMLVFPTAVFLVAPYSEALFLAGAVPAFYFARRGEWSRAVLPTAVATATRAAGIFLIVGLAFELVRRRTKDARSLARAGLALAAGCLPMIAYFAYLARVEGTPLAYFTAQRIGWHREFVGPAASLMKTWELATRSEGPTNWLVAWRFELLAAAVGIGFTVWALLRREWGYAAFMGSTMAALVTSTWYFSVPRMLLTLFPIFVLVASVTRLRPALHEAILVVSGSIAVLGVVVFVQGAWFF